MKDFISRENVCDYIAGFINNPYSTQNECEMVEAMIGGIQHMPSVNQQEPKTGHWIVHERNGIGYLECSECLRLYLEAHLLSNSYCPNCGSHMIEPRESEE